MRAAALLVLSGCACPEFGDIEVVADETVEDPDGAVAFAEQAVADFAAWTGRAGVCVDRVEVREEVMLERPDGPVEVGGYYDGAGTILLEETVALPEALRHELCHALDKSERLSVRNQELFQGEDIDEAALYRSESERIREAFARACEVAPVDLTIVEAAGVACGEDFVGDRARFLDEVVYPDFAEDFPVEPGAPLGPLEWRTTERLVPYRRLRALQGDAHGLSVLMDAHRLRLDGPELALVLLDGDVDAGTWTPRWEVAVADLGGSGTARLLASDTDDTWLLYAGRQLLRIDREGVATFDTVPDWVDVSLGGAVSGGVLYAFETIDSRSRLRAWQLEDRVELLLGVGALGELYGAWPGGIWPVEDGVEVLLDGHLARYAGGAWTTWPAAPGAWSGGASRGGTRAWSSPAGDFRQPLAFDPATGSWTIRPDCERSISRGDRVVTAAGRTWAVNIGTDDEGRYAISLAELDL